MTAFASGARVSGATVGALADDARWSEASHSIGDRPAEVSVPDMIRAHKIDRLGLLKLDIEGAEFAVLAEDEDLSWLDMVEQMTLEVHPSFGDVPALSDGSPVMASWQVQVTMTGPRSVQSRRLPVTSTARGRERGEPGRDSGFPALSQAGCGPSSPGQVRRAVDHNSGWQRWRSGVGFLRSSRKG
jgi:hypothetical protein